MSVSVVVLTKNEERNLPACLESVKWSDDVFVLDSYSEDRTAEIAREAGVRVVRRAFDDHAAHKNWALDNLPLAHKWVLLLDADERVTPELAAEILSAVGGRPDGYYIPRKNMFGGKWIRRGGWYPDYQLRLFRRDKGRYEKRIVGEHVLLEGQAGRLNSHMIHEDFKGIERYFERHNAYSSMEAVEAVRSLHVARLDGGLPGKLTQKGPHRRRFLKTLAYRYLFGRSLVKFIYMYFFKLGFLDGRMGFRFCLLHTFYEYQVSLKIEELLREGSPLREKYKSYMESGPK